MAIAVLLAFVVLHVLGDGDSQNIIQTSRHTFSPFCIFLESMAATGALGIKVIQCGKYPFPTSSRSICVILLSQEVQILVKGGKTVG